MSRMGFEAEAHKIQDLFFEGRRDEAIPLVPTQFADEISLVGSKERIRDRLAGVEGQPGHDDHRERRPGNAADDGRAGRLRRATPTRRGTRASKRRATSRKSSTFQIAST